MNLNLRKGKAIIAALLVVGMLAGCSKYGQNEPLMENLSTMQTQDLEGNEVDSSLFEENKLTVLNIWNVGCTPCVEELPILEQLNNDLASKGVSIKGVYYSMDEKLSEQTLQEIEDVLTNAKATYQQLKLSNSMLESKYFQDLQAFPATLFIDAKGNVVGQKMGSDDYEGWKKAIEKALELVENNA